MELQGFLNLGFSIAVAIAGWFAREIWEQVKSIRKDINQMDVRMHQDFVRRDDFKEAISELKNDMREGFSEVRNSLHLLNEKMDSKSDK